jgi:hypothetical protein
MFGSIALICAIIVLLDRIGRRQARAATSRERARASAVRPPLTEAGNH